MIVNDKIAICCIAKMENLYLRDFVEYHKRIGVDNIILYDNDDKQGESPRQVIGDYIDNGFVIYEDYRGKYRCQLEAYNECYKKYCSQFAWIGFIDVDEFIEIPSKQSIKEWISNSCFSDALAVLLFWVSYGDNGLLHYDKRPVYERFLIPQPINCEYGTTCKLIIRCNPTAYVEFNDVNNVFMSYDDVDELTIKYSNGKLSNEEMLTPVFDGAYLKHYCTLTIDEFLCRRFGRGGYADSATNFTKERVMKIFWDNNERTPEKEKIVEDFFKSHEIIEDIIK